MNYLKKWVGVHAAILVLATGVIAQTANHYLTAHPKADFGGFLGACGLALINAFLKSPTQGDSK